MQVSSKMATASMRSAAFGSSIRSACQTPFRPAVVVARRPVVEVAASGKGAADKKAAKKRTDPAVKRAMLAVERRLYNKARKSACATRVKKVLKAATTMMTQPLASEEEVKPLEKLIAEAYQEIDKAVSKNVLHANTAARRKSRIAKYKRLVLISAGLWTPPADHPDHAKALKIQAKKAEKAAAAGQ